jgi:5,10-methylenetetrahydromethanopterin reductase
VSRPGCPAVGAWFFPEISAPDLLQGFCDAEALGLDEIWIGDEGPAHRDPFAVLAAAATRTEHLRLGVAVTNPYLRHPAVTASAMMTIQELSGGRGLLGLGPGGGVALDPVGIARTQPLARTRDAVRIVRAVTAGVASEGYAPPTDPFTVPALPVFIGARGEQFNRYASEEADGAFLGGIPFALLDRAFGWVRSVRPIDVALYPSVILRDDELEWVRPRFIFAFLDTPASTRDLARLSEGDVRHAVHAFEEGDDRPARTLITDEVLDQLAIVGRPEEIGRRLAALVTRYQPSSIGVCLRTPTSLARGVGDTAALFASLAKELAA